MILRLYETVIFAVLVLLGSALAQVFLPVSLHPPPLQQQPILFHNEPRTLAHRDVIINAEHEARLPSHLINPFYRNPRIAEALAKESWFGPGEVLVSMRETEKIPRSKIISVLKNAGLARRRVPRHPSKGRRQK